jgi:hypothetical protein
MNPSLLQQLAESPGEEKTALLALLLRQRAQESGGAAVTIRDEKGVYLGEFLPAAGPGPDQPIATPSFLKEIVERDYSEEPVMTLEEFLERMKRPEA